MLKELYIENLAVIEKASISFTDKFNVFSGETGAGKSVLIGAINAVLGGRISKDLIRTGTKKASVTALFDSVSTAAAEKLVEYGFEPSDELILQREFSVDGKGIVRICGKPSTVAILKEISSSLIDIHGQHDNRMLVDNSNQRELLDNFAGIRVELDTYGELFRSFSQLLRKIRQLEEADAKKDQRIEELKKQIDEVARLNLKKGEEAEISEKLNRARSFEQLNSALFTAQNAISGDGEGESGALDLLGTAADSLRNISALMPDCSVLCERISGLMIELEDIGGEVAGCIPDPDSENDLPILEEKMSDILRLKRRYGTELDEILDMYDSWRVELNELSDTDNTLAQLSEEKRSLGEQVKEMALEISDKRKAAAQRLTEAISAELKFLDMPDVRLEFAVNHGKVTVNGMDEIEMLISVNKGEELKPIEKVASGGELSRIMLAIKTVLAEHDDTPTMVFDEIDTGISGRAAQKVGRKLSELAQKRQVLCVTHLAQIAALSDNHLLIEKKSDEARTYTTVHTLDYDEKVREIARIISGDATNDVSLRNAEELIKSKERQE